MDEQNLVAVGIVWYVVFLFSTVLHEASHAMVAQMGGDDTAARGGQVSLDPLPHIRREPIGMVLAPLFSFSVNGWMMGWASAPYDPYWAERYPHRAARMAAAGPLANLAIAIVAGIVIKIGVAQGWLDMPTRAYISHVVVGSDGQASALSILLSIAFSLNLLLFTFNLLPVPPLDGYTAVGLFMSEDQARRWHQLLRQPNVALISLVLAWVVFSQLGAWVWHLGLHVLYPQF